MIIDIGGRRQAGIFVSLIGHGADGRYRATAAGIEHLHIDTEKVARRRRRGRDGQIIDPMVVIEAAAIGTQREAPVTRHEGGAQLAEHRRAADS